MDQYFCFVCGKSAGTDPPWGEGGDCPTFEICPCCGCEFGYEDCRASGIKKNRMAWIAKGCPWFNPMQRPDGWNVTDQLRNIPMNLPIGIDNDADDWRSVVQIDR